jgi:GT2 family glycosyltransferase
MISEISPSVAIVILNWQNWADTLACVSSVRKLEYPNYAVIIADNGSSNDSVEKLREQASDCRLLALSDNLGFGGGNNVAISEATAAEFDYIWLLNSDTEVDPFALQALVCCAEADAKIGAVGSVLLYQHSPDTVQAWGGGRINFLLGRSTTLTAKVGAHEVHYLTAASILLRTRALGDAGAFDPKFFMYWEDADLCVRLKQSGWKLAVAEDARVLHRESASLGKRNPVLDLYYSRSVVVFFRKHSKMPSLPIFLSAVLRTAKRLLTGHFRSALAILRGTWEALRQ